MKIKEFIKRNTTGVIIGAILFGGITGVVAATLTALDITYTGNNQTTVKSALDDLYDIATRYDSKSFQGLSFKYFQTSASQGIPNNASDINNYSNESVYIRSIIINDSFVNHNACLKYNNREFCIGANYGNNMTGELLQIKLEQAMTAALNIAPSSCSYSTNVATCKVTNNIMCVATAGASYCTNSTYDAIVTPAKTAVYQLAE